MAEHHVAAAAAIAALVGLAGLQRRRLRRLEREARHDPLTGLPNRRCLGHGWRPGKSRLLFIDLIGFRAVNDRHGHIIGDELLRQLAARLRRVVPAPDRLVRWGGDEFVVITSARQQPERLRQLQHALIPPFDLSAVGGPKAIAVGVRCGASGPETDLADALAVAVNELLASRDDHPAAGTSR